MRLFSPFFCILIIRTPFFVFSIVFLATPELSKSKMLIISPVFFSSVVCTSVPGVFKYQPGVLVDALMAGRWVLIEGECSCVCLNFELSSVGGFSSLFFLYR